MKLFVVFFFLVQFLWVRNFLFSTFGLKGQGVYSMAIELTWVIALVLHTQTQREKGGNRSDGRQDIRKIKKRTRIFRH